MKTKAILTMLLLACALLRLQRYNETTTATTCISTDAYLDDHTLYFTTSCVGDTLQLVQNGVVVYSTVIASDEVELPATLEGDYELQIIHNEWLFYGDIEL